MSDIKPWKTLESTVAFENDRVKIRKDVCQLPDGVIVQDYYVREDKDSSVVFCVTKGQEIVLVRQYRQGSQEITLELPGGYVERHDINPTEAARRELLEETGYAADRCDLIGEWSLNASQSTGTFRLFFATDAERIAATKYVVAEVTETVLMTPADVLAALAKGEIRSLPHIAALYRGLVEMKVLSTHE